MNTINETIHELEDIAREKRVLKEREARAAMPICDDLSKMDDMYARFLEIRPAKGRNVFILIIARVYSPKSLIGANLGSGVRNKLAQVLGVKPTVVSHAFDDLVFHYKRYRNFRSEVDSTFTLMFGENE